MTAVPHYSTRTSSTYDGLSVPSKPHVEKLDVNTDESVLPPPVVQFSPTNRSSGKRKQRARIKESTAQVLRAQWDRLLRKFGAGTAPSASSIDLDAESDRERTSTVGHYNPEWKRFEAAEEIDEVVVEREWGEDIKASSVHSGHGGEKSGSGQPGHASGEDAESVAVSHNDGRCNSPVYAYLRYRIWAAIKSFFTNEFIDEKSEEQYRKETWFMRKVRATSGLCADVERDRALEPGHLVCRILHSQLAFVMCLCPQTYHPGRQDLPLRSTSATCSLHIPR